MTSTARKGKDCPNHTDLTVLILIYDLIEQEIPSNRIYTILCMIIEAKIVCT